MHANHERQAHNNIQTNNHCQATHRCFAIGKTHTSLQVIIGQHTVHAKPFFIAKPQTCASFENNTDTPLPQCLNTWICHCFIYHKVQQVCGSTHYKGVSNHPRTRWVTRDDRGTQAVDGAVILCQITGSTPLPV